MSTLAQRLGLTGSQRIVLDEIEWRNRTGRDVSINRLTEATHYSRNTVTRALQDLQSAGILELRQDCWGSPDVEYLIKEEAC